MLAIAGQKAGQNLLKFLRKFDFSSKHPVKLIQLFSNLDRRKIIIFGHLMGKM